MAARYHSGKTRNGNDRRVFTVEPHAPAADVLVRLQERDRRLAADTRSELQKLLGVILSRSDLRGERATTRLTSKNGKTIWCSVVQHRAEFGPTPIIGGVIPRRTNHTALLATQFAAMFEERSKRLDRVDQAIAKIRSLLRRERKRELQQQSSLVERAKRIRRSA